jgi:hypothetical protein
MVSVRPTRETSTLATVVEAAVAALGAAVVVAPLVPRESCPPRHLLALSFSVQREWFPGWKGEDEEAREKRIRVLALGYCQVTSLDPRRYTLVTQAIRT